MDIFLSEDLCVQLEESWFNNGSLQDAWVCPRRGLICMPDHLVIGYVESHVLLKPQGGGYEEVDGEVFKGAYIGV